MGLRTWIRGQVSRLRERPKASFEAARSGRLSADFMRPNTSANTEISHSLQGLRNGARSLARDNAHTRKIKRTYRVNVIGHRGIQLQPQVKQLTGTELDERRNELISGAWAFWCRKDSCDVTGRNSLLSFQNHIAGALVESGEVFFRIVRQKFGSSKVPLALEIIEADQIDETYTNKSTRPGHRWVMGIELNEWNRPTRYAVLVKHPGDFEFSNPGVAQRHEFVAASDVIHVYGIEERVNQLRCEPILTPNIVTAHNMKEYQKSHLVKKRAQANQLGWIQTPEDFNGEIVDNQRTVESQPGVYRRLNPGESAIPPNYGAEDTVYPDVIRDALRTQAVGSGTSYSTISGDFSEGSYASLRISVFEDRDWWRMLHTAIIDQFMQRVYEEFLYAAVMVGVLPSPTFDDYFFRPERYTFPHWQPRSWGLLDVSKDTAAFEKARELQLETHSEQISNYTGNDFRRTMDKIQNENQYKEGKGLLSPLDDPTQAKEPKPLTAKDIAAARDQ